MRVVLDLQAFQKDQRFLGIGRHNLSLVKNLLSKSREHEFFIILNAKLPGCIPDLLVEFEQIGTNKVRIFDLPIGSDKDAGLLAVSQKMRELFISRLKPDWVVVSQPMTHEPSYYNLGNPVKKNRWQTAVIHYNSPLSIESITRSDRSKASLKSLGNEKRLLENLGDRQQDIDYGDIHFSFHPEFRNQLISEVGITPEKVVALSHGFPQSSPLGLGESMIGESLRNRLKISDYILCILEEHRAVSEIETIKTAYDNLDENLKDKYSLIFATEANPSDLNRIISTEKGLADAPHSKKNDRIIFLEELKPFELQYFFEKASLIILIPNAWNFTSQILEAYRSAVPVIGPNFPKFAELMSNQDALFDPSSLESLSDKIKIVLTDNEFRKSLLAQQQSQIPKFSMNKVADKIIDTLTCLSKKIEERNISDHLEDCSINSEKIILDEFSKHNARPPLPIELAFIANALAYNQGAGKTKQLLVDVSLIVVKDDKSGIQRVVRSLMTQFMENPPLGYRICPVFFDGKIYRYTDKFNRLQSNSSKNDLDFENLEPVDFWQDDIFLSLDLTMHLSDLFEALHLKLKQRGVKLYFVIYDLLPLKHPQWFVDPGPEMYKAWVKKITEHANGLICISKAVADELLEWIEENPLRRKDKVPAISSFHLGADIENSKPSMGIPESAGTLLNQFRNSQTFLMVSTLEPRKGHAQTLRAFDKLWQEDYDINLVIVGKKGWKVDELCDAIEKHPLYNQKLFWLYGVSDEYLGEIYKASTCLIAASEGEGFGLPLIESAHHKIPIIARDLPVFKEVAQNHAYYFSSNKSENLASAIKDWMILFKSGKHPQSEGMPWLNWKESADQLLKNILLF